MNVPSIRGPENYRPGSGEKTLGRAGRKPASRDVKEPLDRVSLSPESSRMAEEVDRLTFLARGGDSDRLEALSEVRAKLDSGELDRPEVFRRTAERILLGE